MAITLGAFTAQKDGSFTGVLKTLNANANLTIVPVSKTSENAPDYRVYAGNGSRYEVGAGWSQVAKSSGETYLNLNGRDGLRFASQAHFRPAISSM